jgi:hypothetical protein
MTLIKRIFTDRERLGQKKENAPDVRANRMRTIVMGQEEMSQSGRPKPYH